MPLNSQHFSSKVPEVLAGLVRVVCSPVWYGLSMILILLYRDDVLVYCQLVLYQVQYQVDYTSYTR